MKTLKQIIKEEIDNSFEWVNDILDYQNLTDYIDNDELVVNKNYLMTGKWQMGVSGDFIELPMEGIEVRFIKINYRTVIFSIIKNFNIRSSYDNEVLFYETGETLHLSYKSDSDTLYLQPLENSINESGDFDWINDIPEAKWDDDWKPEDLIGKLFITDNGIKRKLHKPSDPNLVRIGIDDKSYLELSFSWFRKKIKDGVYKFIGNEKNKNE